VRKMMWVMLLAAGLVCGGCASFNSGVRGLNQRADALEKQTKDQDQRLASQDKAVNDLTTEVTNLKKMLEELRQQEENQAKTNRMLESRLQMGQGPAIAGNPDGGPAGPGKDRGAEWRERAFNQMAESLKLTDEQKEQTKKVMTQSQEKMRQKMTEMRDAGAFDRDKMRAVMEEANKDAETEMQKILTPEQMVEYKNMREKQMARGPGGGDRRGNNANAGSSSDDRNGNDQPTK